VLTQQDIAAANQPVTPAFVDSHFLMDASLILHDQKLRNISGTLLEGIVLGGTLHDFCLPQATRSNLKNAIRACNRNSAVSNQTSGGKFLTYAVC